MIRFRREHPYAQYKSDFFNKLGFDFLPGRRILDVGCGDGVDAEIFIQEYGLKTTAADVYRHERIPRIQGLTFRKASALALPFRNSSFDYVFAHDILHHVDEPAQRIARHLDALREFRRVCKPTGSVLVIEGNRYNPLFYPHMVRMRGHDHFRQSYFERVVRLVFPAAEFRHFEAHLYPKGFTLVGKVYETLMEALSPRAFLAYNAAVVTNPGKGRR